MLLAAAGARAEEARVDATKPGGAHALLWLAKIAFHRFEWLERSYTERNARLRFIKYDPLLRKLRDDPRYTSLLRKMNLPVEQVGWPPSSS